MSEMFHHRDIVVSTMAFHEKAGRSQGNSGFIELLFFSLSKFFPAE